MNNSTSLLLLAVASSVVALACGSDNNPPLVPAKAQGSEGGACFSNSTCNAGLTCLFDLCAYAGTGGAAGGAGAGAAAGSTGSGGTNSSGGGATGGGAGSSGTGGGGPSGGSAGAGAAGGACSECDPMLEQCWNGDRCVAKPVPITGGYSIDATEVTRSQYQKWLDANPMISGQASACNWNKTFAPDATCMTKKQVCQGGGCGRHPQVCVDWCDAVAYCAASGKRLCGKIGGGPNGFSNQSNAALSQLYNACSSGGKNAFPCGDTLGPPICNGAENPDTGCMSGSCTTVEVGTLAGCQSSVVGYEGVFDLSGNVEEWEDSCGLLSGTYYCRIHGGAYNTSMDLRCDQSTSFERTSAGAQNNIGFRCCSL